MHDAVKIIGKGSIIQHGKHNDRIYLMKLDKQDVDIIIDELSKLADMHKYSKLFCKIPKNLAPLFFGEGYIFEAFIPKFYKDNDDVFFVSKFLDSDRLLNIEKDQLSKITQLLSEEHSIKKNVSGYLVRKLTKADVEQMTKIYLEVFESYPFPIHNPEYILETMDENVQYFGVENDGKLVAISSSFMPFSNTA